MKDPLLEATQALREFGERDADAAGFTRARVIASLSTRKRQRKRRWVMAIPLAALAMGSVAMAATGGYLPAPVQKWVAAHAAFIPQPNAKHAPVATRAAPTNSVSTQAVTAVTNSHEPERDSRSTTSDTPSQAAIDSAARTAPTKSVSNNTSALALNSVDKPRPLVGDVPVSEEEFQRYRVAHEAHFIQKDPAAALSAWSDYLAHSPTGRLAVEARYNRALCLLKLGRTSEARAALQPFMAGKYGAYRQKEAHNLVSTLDADAGR